MLLKAIHKNVKSRYPLLILFSFSSFLHKRRSKGNQIISLIYAHTYHKCIQIEVLLTCQEKKSEKSVFQSRSGFIRQYNSDCRLFNHGASSWVNRIMIIAGINIDNSVFFTRKLYFLSDVNIKYPVIIQNSATPFKTKTLIILSS